PGGMRGRSGGASPVAVSIGAAARPARGLCLALLALEVFDRFEHRRRLLRRHVGLVLEVLERLGLRLPLRVGGAALRLLLLALFAWVRILLVRVVRLLAIVGVALALALTLFLLALLLSAGRFLGLPGLPLLVQLAQGELEIVLGVGGSRVETQRLLARP